MSERNINFFLSSCLSYRPAKTVPFLKMSQETAPASIPRDDSAMSKQSAFALLWLFVYSCGMFTLPFAAFFGTRHILLTKYELDTFTVTASSVIAAVVTVNLIIVLYALQGYRDVESENTTTTASTPEPTKDPKTTKKSN